MGFMKEARRGSSSRDDLNSDKPVVLKLVNEPVTIDGEVQVVSNDVELQTLAAEVNLLIQQAAGHEQIAVFHAKESLKLKFEVGDRLVAMQGLTQTFDEVIEKYCPSFGGTKRSKAYDLIRISQNKELREWSVQSVGQIGTTHLVELMRLPADSQEKIKQIFDSGEKVSVSDIKTENKRIKELEAQNASLERAIEAKATENEDLIEQTNALEANFEQAVESVSNKKAAQKVAQAKEEADKKLAAEKAKFKKELADREQKLEQAKRSANSETEEQIADKKEELAYLQRTIESSQQKLNEIEDVEKFNALMEKALNDLLMEKASIAMIERPDFEKHPQSRERLITLANEFNAVAKLCEHIALKQVDIEDYAENPVARKHQSIDQYTITDKIVESGKFNNSNLDATAGKIIVELMMERSENKWSYEDFEKSLNKNIAEKKMLTPDFFNGQNKKNLFEMFFS